MSGTTGTSSTATFLFTDIDGSTRLLEEHRAEYPRILADHHRFLRAAFDAHGGTEIDNQTDAMTGSPCRTGPAESPRAATTSG
jgi:class 3 adenylate cyclase